jgi:transposase InsO family protein
VDNGKQFDCYSFKEYCRTLRTHAKFSLVYHPQSNGAIERENGLIFSGIKKYLLDQKKGKWMDELPKVIWSHNTTVSRATGFTPFLLLFGTEVMTPKEIKNESMRVLKGKKIEEVDQKVEKDMIELMILEAAANIKKYQKETNTWKDRKVVRKDIKDRRSSSKKIEELEKSQKTPRTMGRAVHSQGNKHARGFSPVQPNW